MEKLTDLSPRASAVKPLGARLVQVEFTDGVVAVVDLAPLLRGPAFARVATDDSAFARVRVSPTWGCLEWPGGEDIDPEVLYELATVGRTHTTT